MINDLFDGLTCRICGNSKFERLERLCHKGNIDFICVCHACGTLFVLTYEWQEV